MCTSQCRGVISQTRNGVRLCSRSQSEESAFSASHQQTRRNVRFRTNHAFSEAPTIFRKTITDFLGCEGNCFELIKTVIFVIYWETNFFELNNVFWNSTSHDLSRDNHSTSDRARHELALWCLHHPASVGHHTSGSRLTPKVHPCSRKGGGCGWLTAPKHNNHRNMSPDCNYVNIMS